MPDHPTPGISDPSCIFCKIIAGEVPCHKVYEDDRVLAFLDIAPLSRGHTLVIPKEHYATIDQVPAEDASAVGRIFPILSKAIMQATGATAWNLLQNNGEQAGQDVHHVHFHLIPRLPGTNRKESTPGAGLPATSWPAGEVDDDETAELASKVMKSVRL